MGKIDEYIAERSQKSPSFAKVYKEENEKLKSLHKSTGLIVKSADLQKKEC